MNWAPKTKVICGLLAGLLVTAVAFQVAHVVRKTPPSVPQARLADSIVKSVAGWTVTEERLGPTESVSTAAQSVLNFDDHIFRRYRRGNLSFTVYAAYWAAGRMPTRLVASHTPDRCWTENGLRCVDLRFKQTYEVKGRALLPAEYRVFVPGGLAPEDGSRRPEAGGQRTEAGGRMPPTNHRPPPHRLTDPRTYVIYWHTVEGRLYDYGERFNAVPHPWLWWKDTLAQAAYGSREQLFVRVASETPFEQLWTEPGFQEVMESVAKLGLYRPAAP